jgi:hypothetical protein
LKHLEFAKVAGWGLNVFVDAIPLPKEVLTLSRKKSLMNKNDGTPCDRTLFFEVYSTK